jgi:hypothetical protein
MSVSDGILMLMIGVPFGVFVMFIILKAIEKHDEQRFKNDKK